MPELAPSSAPPSASFESHATDRLGRPQQFPAPWPGMPAGLETMSMAELGWWGQRFGVDTPYYATPTGWGEWIPLYGIDVLSVRDVVVLDPMRQLQPHVGLRPKVGLHPSARRGYEGP